MKHYFLRNTISTLLLSSALVTTPFSATQAAECKGMAQKACESSSTCSWVNTYKTKAGKTVQGYCRNKSSKTSTQKKTKSSAEAASAEKK